MNKTVWILLDTETTGLAAPIFVVELAAQRMRGWSAEGEPFRKLLNQNQEIPAEASRVHGYTCEILERDGEPAQQVYREFAAYAGNLPTLRTLGLLDPLLDSSVPTGDYTYSVTSPGSDAFQATATRVGGIDYLTIDQDGRTGGSITFGFE